MLTRAVQRPGVALILVLGFHMLLWTLLPAVFTASLPLDVIEGLAWGHEWQLGYLKHPPLYPWLMELASRLEEGANWPLYLLSQLAVVIAFWALWLLARARRTAW